MRRLFCGICRPGKIAAASLAVWSAACGPAWAQPPGQQQGPAQTVNSGVWVFAYFVVILGIALGVLAVCLSSRRRERARPEQYGEGKTAVAEEKK